MDEPSEGLAPLIVRSLAETIDELRTRGLGILLCEQNQRLVLDLADRAYLIEKGRICGTGAPRELQESGAVARHLGL